MPEEHPPDDVPAAVPEEDSRDSSGTREKYYLLMELGQGGTAVVHAAIARGLGGFSKLVVLKRTKEEFSTHRDAVRMFLNEARLSSRMNHPNVVQVYEVFEDAGLPVIVMEHLDGQSLDKVLQRACKDPVKSGYTLEVAISIVCKALEGLHYAHTLSDFNGQPLEIVHRDATPHNVMLTYDGQVKLLDFGIAKLNVSSNQTKTGVIKGKLGYMPREQVDGSQLDCRADVFAMGVILYESIARRRLWGKRSDAEIMHGLICDEIPRLSAALPDVDPELDRICARAMAPELDDRYPSAQALLADLEAFLAPRGGVSSSEKIARYVTDSCADLRIAAKTRLDHELAKFSERDSGSWDSAGSLAGIGGDGRLVAGTGRHTGITGSGGGPTANYYQQQFGPPPLARSATGWIAAALFTIAGVAGWWVWQQGSIASSPAAPTALTNPPTTPLAAPEVPPQVRVVVAATPESSALYLDGARLATNPFIITRDRDGSEHQLRVAAPGHKESARTIVLDADQNVLVTLEAVPEVKAAPVAKPSTPKPRTRRRQNARKPRKPTPTVSPPKPVPTPPAVKEPDCDPPYYVDAAGIKHYRRECLGG